MNDEQDAAHRLYPTSPWNDAVINKQYRLSAHLCLHPKRWPATEFFCRETDFANTPFRKRGRPQVPWDDNV